MNHLLAILDKILPAVVVFGSMTIIEFVPVKVNPWSAIAKLLKKAVGTDKLEEKFNAIDKQFIKVDGKLNSIDTKFDQKIFSLKKETAEGEAVRLRTAILDFWANLKCGALFDEDQWEEIYRKIDRYADITSEFHIENSYCNDAIKGIRRYAQNPELKNKQTLVIESEVY